MTYKVPEITRYEIKYIARETELHSILNWIRMHSEGFVTAYPDRWINNIYFDSPDFAAYMDNLSGASSRSKVRYRWYGNGSLAPDIGTLEIKRKRNLSVWKLLFPVNEKPHQDGDRWRTVLERIKKHLPEEGKEWLNEYPDPILVNRYYRRYFVTPDQQIRITVDTRQQVWDQRFKSGLNTAQPANMPEILVVEVKFDRKERDRVTEILKNIPIRYSRYSKYMMGHQTIHQ